MIVHVFRYLAVLRSPSPAGSHSRRACQERDWWQSATRGTDQTYSYHAVSNSPVTNAGPCRFIQETIFRLLMEIDAECGNSRWKSVGLWWADGLDSAICNILRQHEEKQYESTQNQVTHSYCFRPARVIFTPVFCTPIYTFDSALWVNRCQTKTRSVSHQSLTLGIKHNW